MVYNVSIYIDIKRWCTLFSRDTIIPAKVQSCAHWQGSDKHGIRFWLFPAKNWAQLFQVTKRFFVRENLLMSQGQFKLIQHHSSTCASKPMSLTSCAKMGQFPCPVFAHGFPSPPKTAHPNFRSFRRSENQMCWNTRGPLGLFQPTDHILSPFTPDFPLLKKWPT